MNTRAIPIDGAALRAARSAKFLLQSELADRVGSTATTIYRLETGRQRCSLHLLGKLCGVLEVEAVTLVSPAARDEFTNTTE